MLRVPTLARSQMEESAGATRRHSGRKPAAEQPFVRANEFCEPAGYPLYVFVVSVIVVRHQPLVMAQLPDDPRGAGQFRFGVADETRQDAKPRTRQGGLEDGLSR